MFKSFDRAKIGFAILAGLKNLPQTERTKVDTKQTLIS